MTPSPMQFESDPVPWSDIPEGCQCWMSSSDNTPTYSRGSVTVENGEMYGGEKHDAHRMILDATPERWRTVDRMLDMSDDEELWIEEK